MSDFPARAHLSLADSQMRRNVRKAVTTIRIKTGRVIAERADWQELRDAGSAIKAEALGSLDTLLIQLEERVQAAGGVVHWAQDAAEARQIIVGLVKATRSPSVIKIKSMTTDEIELNPALSAAGIRPIETDLADMIVQLAKEKPSHLLVPAIHKNRAEIRTLFQAEMGRHDLSDNPRDLANAARAYLREHFTHTKVAISGANFAIAETGAVGVVESEGNGRMCLTLPETLISIMGIEKVLPRWQDLEVFLQLLPRAATGERMNPYNSLWTGVTPGDGPSVFHLVLLDNGRTRILADSVARQTLHCIRCSRCLNVCPVFERTGGHAYDSMYQGPIGAILTPQLRGLAEAGSLAFASSLCGACHEACPVQIDIPRVLVHLRGASVAATRGRPSVEGLAMAAAARIFGSAALFGFAENAAANVTSLLDHDGMMPRLPGLSAWQMSRELPAPAKQSFRAWLKARGK